MPFSIQTELNATAANETQMTIILTFLPMAIVSCATVGIPLNLLVASVIIAQQRLHKPRHIFWLGVIFSNVFALLLSINELFVFYIIPDSRPACLIFVLLIGIPYATLLLNLLLGLIDRFIAITYPLWHKNKVTIRRIITTQWTGFFLISILFKISYLLDGSLMDISCQQHQPHGKLIVITLMTLILLCISAQIAIYFKTKSYFVQQRECQREPLSSRLGLSESICTSNQRNIAMANKRHEPEFFIHIGSETISKLEVEAAWTVVQGVTSLIIISSPIFIVSLSVLYCNKVYDDCTAFTWMIPYFRELVLAHTVYNPIMYIWRSHEFSSAFRRKCCRNRES